MPLDNILQIIISRMWARSYHKVADQVNSCVQKGNRKLANEAFCIVAKHVTLAKCKDHVLHLFDVLRGSSSITSLSHVRKYLHIQALMCVA